ncbi:hypothetical protein [Flagellimonas sp.]|uniref:hypothetical protein n=1 Tax=Flagellimonas sp. TaxID=2058762 RepID=UPI003F4A51C2
MISIQEQLNCYNPDRKLSLAALFLWKFLNKRNKGGQLHYSSIVKRTEKAEFFVNSKEYFEKFADQNQTRLDRHVAFINLLRENNHQFLKRLIIAPPNELFSLKETIMSILEKEDLIEVHKGRFVATKFNKLISKKIFNYESFRRSAFCAKLYYHLGFNSVTCPYCNDNTISIVDISEDSGVNLKAYLDIDHFYARLHNPFFGLSFFNLIPSCTDCNSREKGDKDFCITTHNNPYFKSFNSRYSFRTDAQSLTGSSNNIYLEYIDNSCEDFTVRDLRLQYRYRGKHLGTLNSLIRTYLDNLHHLDVPELHDIAKKLILKEVPTQVPEIAKHTAGKMKRDILISIDCKGII